MGRKPLLAELLNDHSYIKTVEQASRFKTGLLDADLIAQQLTKLDFEPVVGVKFFRFAENNIHHRLDPVFEVTTQDGRFAGHYFASAFKSLNT